MKKRIYFACLPLFFAITAFAQNNFVYTNDSVSPNTVSAFSVNTDGSLTLLAGSPFLTGGNGGGRDINPGNITTATARERSFLYVANNSDTTISAFAINRQTGDLTAVSGSPFAAGAPNSNSTITLASSPNGRFLFEVDEASTFIRIFNIARSGALTEAAGSPVDTGAFSEGLKVSANGRFLIVGLKTLDAVGVFTIGPEGTLTAVLGSPFLTSGAASAVEANCANNRVFAVNAGSTLIDAFVMAPDGTLSPVQGSPFPSGSNITVPALVLTPRNRFLLTTNAFDSTASSLAVARNGSLQPVAGSPFAADDWPGAVATTRDGKFVYASLFTEAQVDGWSIGADGTLTPVPGRPFASNQSGVGVQALTTFPAPGCSLPELL